MQREKNEKADLLQEGKRHVISQNARHSSMAYITSERISPWIDMTARMLTKSFAILIAPLRDQELEKHSGRGNQC
jgi:hypothetical protein